jgi:hypothetical protein
MIGPERGANPRQRPMTAADGAKSNELIELQTVNERPENTDLMVALCEY